MTELLILEDARTRVGIVPDLGGGVAEADALLPDGPSPMLRAWTGNPEDGPFALASNVLVPFSNRISCGGFTLDDTFHAIPPNLEGEPCPIHGDGFQRAWSIRERSKTKATLVLDEGTIGPFRYRAEQTFSLMDGKLSIDLTLTNRAGRRLPYGAGFHPWFPRTPATQLQFRADGVWLEDANHLPTSHVDLAAMPAWDFSNKRALPATWINNAFTGWQRTARIHQPDHGIDVQVGASSNMETVIAYSPEENAGFFCFEPVTHAVDAHNRDGFPGLAILDDGQSLSVAMSIECTALCSLDQGSQ